MLLRAKMDVLEIIRSPSYDPKKIFTDDKERFTQVKTAFENINGLLPRDKCILFLTEKITPTIFDKNINNTTRDQAIEIGFALLNYVNVTHLPHAEINNFLTSIEEKYVVVIGELRDNNYANWDKLWIFLIKLCHRKINHKLTLTNKFLRTIEVAFRNSTSIDHRVKAYDCWIEWINLCSLNMPFMCSPKQLRLLITPMRAKFSRMPVIVQKRCETFVYLLEKLEDKATLCLKEFLEFCFGPFDENKQSEGKNVAGVFQMGTKVLIASIGHNHLNQKCISVADMKFKNPLINASNFTNFCETLINSVVECCILLNEWESGSKDVEKTVMQCLWRSLRVLIDESSTETKHTCLTQLENTLKDIKKRIANDKFCSTVLQNVIEVMIEPTVYDNLKKSILSYSLDLLNQNPEENSSSDKLLDFILDCIKSETHAKVVCDYFQLSIKYENSKVFGEIWIKNRYFEDFSENATLSYLIWPVKNCHDFENKEGLYDKWLKLYSNACKTEKFKSIIIQEIDKLFQENPLLSSNIVPFLKLVAEPNSKDNELVGKYIKLISSLSTLPNLDDNSKQTLSTIILAFFDQGLPIFADIHNNDSIKKLCESLENIVNVHKDYKILSKLTKKLSESPSKSLSKFSKVVMPILENLMLNDDTNVLNDSRKLIELFESKENEPEMKPASSSRTMRMLNMANPSTPTNSLKFFGKNAETSTPLNAKSGNSQKTTPQSSVKKNAGEGSGRKRKFMAALGNDESSSSDYVKISTEVKFEPSKLSEHQKEVYRKRREDIPALYEDLSQSQMSNMSSDSNSRAVKNGLDKVDGERKSGEEGGNEQNKTESLAKSSKDTGETDKTKALRKSTRQTFKQIKFTTDEFFVTPLKKQKLSDEAAEKSSDEEKKPKKRLSSVRNDGEKLHKEKRKSSSKKIDDFLVEGSKAENLRRKSSSSKPTEGNQAPKSEETKSVDEIKPEEKEKAQKEKRQSSVSKKVDDSALENQTQAENSRRKSSGSKQIASNPSSKSDESEKSKETEEIIKPEEKVQREKRKYVKKVEESTTENQNQESKSDSSRRKSLVSKQTEGNQPSKSSESEKSKPIEETKPEEEAQKEKRKSSIKKLDDSIAENPKQDSKAENMRRKLLILKKTEINQPSKSDESEKSKPIEETKPEEKVQKEKRKSFTKKTDDSSAENQAESVRRKSKSEEKNKPEETKPESVQIPEEETKKSASEAESAKKPISLKRNSSAKQPEISPETPDIVESSETQTSSRRRSLFKPAEMAQEAPKSGDSVVEKKQASPPPAAKSKIAITASTEELQKTLIEDLSFSLSEDSAENKKQEGEEEKCLETKTKKKKPKVIQGTRTLRARKSKEDSCQHVTADTSPTDLATKAPAISETDQSVIVVNDSTIIELDSILEPTEKAILPESEDIIESSQDPEVKPKFIKQKREEKSKLSESSELFQETSSSGDEHDKIIPTMKTLSVKLSQLTALDFSKAPVEEHSSPTEDKKTPRRSPRSSPRLKRSASEQSPPLADTESVVFIPSEQLPETETCEIIPSVCVTLTQDVPEMTLRSECLTPILQQKARGEDLPSSPVTFDTPDRTVELLNNTSDISPISEQQLQSIAESATPVHVAKHSKLKPGLRVARLLQMANPGVSMASPSGANWRELQCSPSRTKRMKMKRGEELQVLTFSREIPSPLVVPSSGILKRKICGDESVLPSPKRKRVNFSDPAITEKKVFIKDSEEYGESSEPSMNGDYEETHEPTEKVIQLDDLDKLLEADLEREEMFPIIKALCELKFKSLNVDNAKFHSIFKTISEDSGVVPEIVDSISNYLEKKDESEECRQLFLHNLYLTLEDLTTEKIEAFIKRLVEVFNCEKESKVSSIENIFDHESIMSKVKDYVESLFDDDERNQFLVKLMQFSSSNLPVQKQFLQNHLDLVQGFVVRMD